MIHDLKATYSSTKQINVQFFIINMDVCCAQHSVEKKMFINHLLYQESAQTERLHLFFVLFLPGLKEKKKHNNFICILGILEFSRILEIEYPIDPIDL